MSDIYGQDISTFPAGSTTPDLDPNFTVIESTMAVSQCVARGLVMARARLIDIGDTPRAGCDIRRYLSARIDRNVLLRIKIDVEREAKLDERVLTATANVSFNTAEHKIRIDLKGTTSQGPFELVVEIGKLTTELLKAS